LAFAGGRVPHHAQVADDAVVLGVAGADVLVHPVPFRPKLRHPALEFFHDATAPGAEPSLASTAGLTPPRPLRAIVVLSQDAGAAAAPTPVVVPSAAAFSALLRHAHCFDDADPVERRRLVESYLAIAERVPVFRLTYRPDLGGLSSLAATVVRTVSAPRPRPRASRAQLQHV
jgi:hypothetical protein